MSELLFTGQVPIPDLAGGVEKTSQILQNYSALQLAERKAKADAYKRTEARKNRLREDYFSNTAFAKILPSVRPAVYQGVNYYLNKYMEVDDIPGGEDASAFLALATNVITDAILPDVSKQRNDHIEGLQNPLASGNSVLSVTYTEEGLAENDAIYNLTGAESRFNPETGQIEVREVGATDFVPLAETEASMATAPYAPKISLKSAPSTTFYADKWNKTFGDGMRSRGNGKFNEAQFYADFAGLFLDTDKNLQVAPNLNVDSDQARNQLKVYEELQKLGPEKGLVFQELNNESFRAFSSGSPNSPFFQGEYKERGYIQEAVKRIADEVMPMAKSMFREAAVKTNPADTTAARIRKNKEDMLDSMSADPLAIPFTDEDGNTRTLYGHRFRGKKLETIDKIQVDTGAAEDRWIAGQQEYIDQYLEEKRREFGEEVVQERLADYTRFAEKEYEEGPAGKKPDPTDEKQKMQVFFKAYDPEIQKHRVFFQGPASSATDQTDLFELKFESPSFPEFEEILRNEYGFEDALNDSDLPGTEDYTPPQQDGGVQEDDFGNPIKQ